ncbi:hypothetical protein CU097_014353 [Rhizopus azygosporus]|uniref:Tetraspanin n=1 Tax=Rhizopus azygosporus TaxID=86630 RepID=A0A367K6R4_RHIAZ|nr:hypothetical protein CU097_014353 [Rhizopus azygosporus]
MMAIHLKISVAMLIPINILKMISILGIILVFTSLIGLLGSFYRERRSLHILCTTTVIIAFLYQISIAIMVYNQAAHTTSWLSEAWAESSVDYRLYAQTKLHCCGFTGPSDHPVPSPTCVPHQLTNSEQPCRDPMNQYMREELTHIYIVLFTSLAIEILALCNSITHLCTMNPTRSWEVSPEHVEQKKFASMNEYNASAATLVNPVYSKYKRQF